jgi:hypothetical protein
VAAASSPCLAASSDPPVLSVPCAATSSARAPCFPGCLRCSRSRAPCFPCCLRCSRSRVRLPPVLVLPAFLATSGALGPRLPAFPAAFGAPSLAPCSLLPARRNPVLPPPGAAHPVLPPPELWCSHLPAPSYPRDASGAPSSKALVLPPPRYLLPAWRIRFSLLQSSGIISEYLNVSNTVLNEADRI